MAQIPDLPIKQEEEKPSITKKDIKELDEMRKDLHKTAFPKKIETETLLPFPEFKVETKEEILVPEKNRFMLKEFLENQIFRRYWQIILISSILLILMLFV